MKRNITLTRTRLPSGKYLIRSVSEQGYWSNTLGWVYDVASATQFDSKDNGLPMSRGKDADFVDCADAHDFNPDDPEDDMACSSASSCDHRRYCN